MITPHTSALELAKIIREKRVSPLEVVNYYLSRIDRFNGEFNAVTYRRDDELREEARQAERKILSGDPLPPFWGVPILIKLLTPVKGWPYNHASAVAKNNTADFSHDVVTALQQAGFLLMGQSSSPEFGSLPVTESKLYGQTRNPWNPEYSGGGSSGGAAVAVASSMAPIAEGSDGGGSIRIPASCCSLVGLKPSRGRVRRGPKACDSGVTTKGCISKTVADTAAFLDVVSTFDPYAWFNAPAPERPFISEVGKSPGKLRIAFTTKSPLGDAVDRPLIDAVEKVAKQCQALGHEVFEGAPEWGAPQDFIDNFLVLWATATAEIDPKGDETFEVQNLFLRAQADRNSSIRLQQANFILQRISRKVSAAWTSRFDVLLTPTMGREPPLIGEILSGLEQDSRSAFDRSFKLVPFTPWFNVTGQPAISVPSIVSPSGLPIGVQLVGAPWDEATLIRLASQLEKAMEWPRWSEK